MCVGVNALRSCRTSYLIFSFPATFLLEKRQAYFDFVDDAFAALQEKRLEADRKCKRFRNPTR